MRKASLAFGAGLTLVVLAGCEASQPFETEALPSQSQASESFAALIEQARGAVQEGDFAASGRLLEKAREAEPDNPALWVEIARTRFVAGEHIQALEAADRAVELGPAFAPALLLRAQFVRDGYGLTDSLVWFEAAVEADPNDPLALAEYAATLGDAGYYTEMLGVTRALADIEPKNPKVFYLKAVMAARAGKPVLAQSLIERSGLARDGVPSAILLDAVLDLLERNYDSAAQSLERLAQSQPGNQRVADLLARALWLGGRDPELVERFGDQALHASGSPYLAMLVARALERQGDRANAAPYLEKAYQGRGSEWVALPGQPGLPEPTFQIRRLVEEARVQAAHRRARQLKGRFPGSSDIAVLAGDASLASGRLQDALGAYTMAASVRRPWPLTRKLAAAYRKFGDPQAADALLARHLVSEPRNTEALFLNATRAARFEDWLRVAVLLDNAITLGAGNDPALLNVRAQAARALGEQEEAMRFERLTWELHPGFPPQS
ncbi:MAG: tetratricopeptide repeat protein [Pseudomonadota bacterium]